MATKVRRRRSSLIDRLRAAPYRFSLLQAVQIAEAARPGSRALGEGISPAAEALSLRGSLSQKFPASDLESWLDNSRTGKPELTSAFLSLGGAFGPLPPPYSELARDRLRCGDHGIRDFLDIFNHRLLSLFVRIKRCYQPALQPDLPENTRFSRYLRALLGLLTDGLSHDAAQKSRLCGQDSALMACCGLLNQRPISAHMLEQALSYAFALPVRIHSFVGRWLPLSSAQTTKLGQDNSRLGQSAVIGRQVWDQTAAIIAEIRPRTLDGLRHFLPGASGHEQLRTLLFYLLGDTIKSEIRLILPAEKIPQSRLSTNPSNGPRLGWTSWIGNQPHRGDGEVRLGPPPQKPQQFVPARPGARVTVLRQP